MAQDVIGTVGINAHVIAVIGLSMLSADGVGDQTYNGPTKVTAAAG